MKYNGVLIGIHFWEHDVSSLVHFMRFTCISNLWLLEQENL
jgi:hypothetical protein